MPPRSASRRLWLVVGSVLLALAMTEVGLRLTWNHLFTDSFTIPDEVRGWALRPSFGGWSTDENNLWVEDNSAGFRDRERSLTAAPNTIRVAVMGDSFIHAYFVRPEDSFTSRLEEGLSTCAPAGRRVEALSFGVLGYNTTQELLTHRDPASRYSPNIVVVAVYTQNDIYDNYAALSTEPAPRFVFQGDELVLDNAFRSQLPKPSSWPLRRRAFEYLTLHSRTIRLLNFGQGSLREFLNGGEPTAPTALPSTYLDDALYRPPVDKEIQAAWNVTEAVLLKFAEEVKANGAEFWIVTLSNTVQVDPDLAKRTALQERLGVASLFYPDRRIASFAQAHGIRVVSLAEPLADYAAARGTYLNGGHTSEVPLGSGHYNEVGNKVAADLASKAVCAGSDALRARE